jgi:hypothetical protein
MSIFKRASNSTADMYTWLDDRERKLRRRRFAKQVGRATFLIGLALITTFKSGVTVIKSGTDRLVAVEAPAGLQGEDAFIRKPNGEEDDALGPSKPEMGPKETEPPEKSDLSDPSANREDRPEANPTEEANESREAVKDITEWLRKRKKKR